MSDGTCTTRLAGVNHGTAVAVLFLLGLMHAATAVMPALTTVADGSELLVCLHNEQQQHLGIMPDDTITVTCDNAAGERILVTDTTNAGMLLAAIETVVDRISPWIDVSVTGDGRIGIDNSSSPPSVIGNMAVRSSNAGTGALVAGAFQFPAAIQPSEQAETPVIHHADLPAAGCRALTATTKHAVSRNGATPAFMTLRINNRAYRVPQTGGPNQRLVITDLSGNTMTAALTSDCLTGVSPAAPGIYVVKVCESGSGRYPVPLIIR